MRVYDVVDRATPENLWDERYQHPYTKFSGFSENYADDSDDYGYFYVCACGNAAVFGFWGKLYLISAAINSDYIWLAVVIALSRVPLPFIII